MRFYRIDSFNFSKISKIVSYSKVFNKYPFSLFWDIRGYIKDNSIERYYLNNIWALNEWVVENLSIDIRDLLDIEKIKRLIEEISCIRKLFKINLIVDDPKVLCYVWLFISQLNSKIKITIKSKTKLDAYTILEFKAKFWFFNFIHQN